MRGQRARGARIGRRQVGRVAQRLAASRFDLFARDGARALQSALDVLGAQAAHIALWARSPIKSRSPRVLQRRMPDDAAAAAQQLFALLRSFDVEGVKLIWIEMPPDTPEWEGVRDRLQRAAAA